MSQHLFIIPVMHPAADTVDSSEEDMPLSALAGRHTSGSQTTASAHAPQARPQARAQNQAQPQAGAQAPAVPASQRVARSRKADKLDAKPGLHVPNKVTAPMELSSIAVVTGAAADADAPAEKDTSAAHQGSPESAPAVVTAAAAEVPAENDSAAARQGSPEPALAPANVEVRTTRSQSRRMSMEASPSVTTSVMTRSALKGQSGGQAAMTKPPPAGRKRSATPAYPPAAPEASPTAAAAASADGDAQGAPVVSNKKHRSRSVDGDSKQGVAPRRSSRLSIGGVASTPDSSQPPELTQVFEQENQAEHSEVAVESAAHTTAAKAAAEPLACLQARDAPADEAGQTPAQAASDDFCQFASSGHLQRQDAPSAQAAARPAQEAEVLSIAEPRVQLLSAPSSEAVTEAAAARTLQAGNPQAAATEPQAADAAAATTATTGDAAEPNNRLTGTTGPDSLPEAPASSGAHLDVSTAERPADDVDQLALVQPIASTGASPEVDAKGGIACPAVADAADALPQPEATTGAVMPGSAGMAAVASSSPIPVTADTSTAEAMTTPSVEAAATAAAAAGPAKPAASTEAVPNAAADSTNAVLAKAASKATPEDLSTVPSAKPSKAAATASETSEDVSTRPAETASKAAARAAATAPEDISMMSAAAASRAPSGPTAEAAVKAPPLVKLPGTTRIGLPSRPGLLGKGGLAGLGPSGGSTHIGPALSRGLLSALPTKAKASSETKQPTSAGSAGKTVFCVGQHCEMTCVHPCMQLQVCWLCCHQLQYF